MMMHLLRKASASNSDTFERYDMHKLRGTFPIVTLVEQAPARNITPCDGACKSAESPEPTKLTTRFCTRSSRSSPWDLGAPPQIWEQYSIHGRMVDLYIHKMDTGVKPYKGSPLSLKQPWQWTVYMSSSP